MILIKYKMLYMYKMHLDYMTNGVSMQKPHNCDNKTKLGY